MRSTTALMLVVFGVYSSGCSLIFTKGPQPEVKPPPPCTTDNNMPITDTVIASLSAVALVGGAILLASPAPQSCRGTWTCGWAEGFTGAGLVLGGLVGTAIFTPSAIVGYMRTADCRASLGLEPPKPASSPMPESSFLLAPQRGCPQAGDVPRLCSSAASWRSTVLARGDVTSRGGVP
jgi:hypothetical protein